MQVVETGAVPSSSEQLIIITYFRVVYFHDAPSCRPVFLLLHHVLMPCKGNQQWWTAHECPCLSWYFTRDCLHAGCEVECPAPSVILLCVHPALHTSEMLMLDPVMNLLNPAMTPASSRFETYSTITIPTQSSPASGPFLPKRASCLSHFICMVLIMLHEGNISHIFSSPLSSALCNSYVTLRNAVKGTLSVQVYEVIVKVKESKTSAIIT